MFSFIMFYNFFTCLFIISWERGIPKTFWCNNRCFFNYIYIMVVEHFSKDSAVFNTVICFSRDQLVFFFFYFGILIFYSFYLYVFVWYCTFVCNNTSDFIPECLACCMVLIFGNLFELIFLSFLVSVLHLLFTFL